MRSWVQVLWVFWLGLLGWPSPLPAAERPPVSDSFHRLMREAVIAILREGNRRFVSGQPEYPNRDVERRRLTAADGQEPFATVLACSDSRVPVEVIFDRGIGDLFVIRVAGNVAGNSELASLEYGVTHLHTPLLVVLGHSHCGAVTAVARNAELHGHLPVIAEKIRPAVLQAKTENPPADELVAKAVEANVWQTLGDIIRQSSAIRERLAARQIIALGAVYHLESGEVAWLGPHPQETQLIAPQADAVAQAETNVATREAAAASPVSSAAPQELPVDNSLLTEPVVDPLESLRRAPVHRPVSHSAKSF